MLPPVTEVAHIADNRNGEFEAAHCRSPCLTTVGKGDILISAEILQRAALAEKRCIYPIRMDLRGQTESDKRVVSDGRL